MDRTSEETAHAFEDEVFFSLRRQRTMFAWMAILSLLIAFASLIAMLIVLPLKEIRPYVVMVDRATGESEQIVASRPANLSEEQAVRESELVRYITDRETYDVSDNDSRIRQVLEISDAGAATSLRSLWNRTADDFPPKVYGRNTLITVRIRSVSLLDDNTAQVRFMRHLERENLQPVERDFVATIGFEFRPRVERRLDQVWQNPLGFTVTSYRVDAETLNPRGTN